MGKVERRHRHIVDTGLTLLAHAGLDFKYWHFAFETAVFLINRLPSSVNPNTSPFELLFHCAPDYGFLRAFGCLCFPYIRPYQHHKVSYRSTPSIFLGYSPHHNGYRCLCLQTQRLYIAKHVQFRENIFPLARPSLLGPLPSHSTTAPTMPSPYASAPVDSLSSVSPSHHPVQSTSVSSSSHHQFSSPLLPPFQSANPAPTPLSSAPSSSFPTSGVPSSPAPPIYRTRSTTHSLKPTVRFSPSAYVSSSSVSNAFEPTCFSQANSCPLWRAAMQDEINAMLRTNTWTLVPRSSSMNVIGCRWIFRLKRDSQGQVVRRRARLVAKGNHQQEGVDFFDTFSPVVKHATIHILLSIVVIFSCPVKQLDIQNAFLNGDLSKVVYIQQLPGFTTDHPSNLGCRLNRSLYGIKQAPRAVLGQVWVCDLPG